MTKTLLALALSAAIGISSSAEARTATDLRSRLNATTESFGLAPKSKAEGHTWQALSSKFNSPLKEAPKTDTDVKMDPSENFAYLDMPDGSTWFTITNIRKEVISQNEYNTEYKYTGFETKIYDHNYELVGTIDSDIDLPEGYERCTNIQFGSLVTQKFFNTDSNYELMVMLNFKPENGYGADPYTYVFSLRGASTPAEKIANIKGYYVDAVNAATDKWSEDYYITFYTSEEYVEPVNSDGIAQLLYTYNIYTKASYSNPSASVLKEFVFDMMYVMSDGENEIQSPVLLQANNGTAYAVTARYAKTFFKDPLNFMNDELSEDNSYIIELYKASGYSTKTMALESTTTIPCEKPVEPYTMRSYCLGRFSGSNDISFDFGAGVTPSYIITVRDADQRENSESHFAVYDTAGEVVKTFGGAATEATLMLSDVKGQPHQFCFYEANADGLMELAMYDFPSFEKKAVLPLSIENDGKQMKLSLTLDRVASGARYSYVVAGLNGDSDSEGNTLHPVAWFDHNGNFDHLDNIMGGQNVVLIQPYIAGFVLDPFLFNTDNQLEYIAFVMRNEEHGTSRTHTELIVVGQDGKYDFQYAFPSSATAPNAAIVNPGLNPAVWITYYDPETQLHHSEFLSLPLNALEGEGTVENPYLLSTAGDFARIANNLSAHYRLACDIDFNGATFDGITGTFMGSLDGAGFSIRNIALDKNALFDAIGMNASDTRPVVKDLTLSHVTVNEAPASLVRNLNNSVLENVFIYDLKVDNADAFDFGGLASSARFGSVIKGCAVFGDINVPGAIGVGGIVYELNSESTISASAFNGSITGMRNVGGIAGNLGNSTVSVTDCHVNATITAENGVGGIAGTSNRGVITRCYVEGEINATTAASGWSEFTGGPVKSINAGGILGILSAPSQSYSDTGAVIPGKFNDAVVNNVVAIDALNIPADEESLKATAHRIVGHTVANDDPLILGEEYNPSTYEWEIKWGDKQVETGIKNNFVVSDLAAIDATVDATADSTEGKTDVENAIADVLRQLGFQFNGYSVEAPWITGMTGSPALYFESTVGAAIFFDPSQISLTEGEKGFALLMLENVDFESLTMESSDESGCMINPVEFDEDGNVVCEISCLKAGSYTITATNGTIKATLLVTGLSGIDEIITDAASAISFDGNTVSAADSAITLYNISGMAVASGRDAVSTATLATGVYVAVAVDATGATSTLKIVVK